MYQQIESWNEIISRPGDEPLAGPFEEIQMLRRYSEKLEAELELRCYGEED